MSAMPLSGCSSPPPRLSGSLVNTIARCVIGPCACAILLSPMLASAEQLPQPAPSSNESPSTVTTMQRVDQHTRRLVNVFGTIEFIDLGQREVMLFAHDSNARSEHSRGYVGTANASAPHIKLPAGQYIAKYLARNRYSPGIHNTIAVKRGDRLRIELGAIRIPHQLNRKIMVFLAASGSRSENDYGYAGSLEPGENSALNVPAGKYRLKFFADNPFARGLVTDVVAVSSGETVDINLGQISIQGLGEQRYMVVKRGVRVDPQAPHMAAGFGGWISQGQPRLELPPGTYDLRLAHGERLVDGIQVRANEEVVIQ